MTEFGYTGGATADAIARLRAALGTASMTPQEVTAFLDANAETAWYACRGYSAGRLATVLHLHEPTVRAWFEARVKRHNAQAGGHARSLAPYRKGM